MTKKPVVLVIMDGVGKGDGGPGDAVKLANTPNLDRLFATCPHNWLKAHGTAVGLPTDDDMGNSEVGHNALGCGQIYSQGAKLVGESLFVELEVDLFTARIFEEEQIILIQEVNQIVLANFDLHVTLFLFTEIK